MHRRKRIFHLANIVHAVTIHAVGHVGITRRQPLAVYAGLVLRHLVHALARLVLLHQTGVAVAMRAAFRHRRAQESFPTNPRALLIDASGSIALRFPPWQSAQLNPKRAWMSLAKRLCRGL